MIVGSSGAVLFGARTISAPATSVRVGGRSCAVAAGTPLAVLAALRRAGAPGFALRDYGRCDSSARNSAQLFVYSIGGQRNSGQNGWEYKADGGLRHDRSGGPERTTRRRPAPALRGARAVVLVSRRRRRLSAHARRRPGELNGRQGRLADGDGERLRQRRSGRAHRGGDRHARIGLRVHQCGRPRDADSAADTRGDTSCPHRAAGLVASFPESIAVR